MSVADEPKIDEPAHSWLETVEFDPEWDLLVGHILVLFGFLMPWFKTSDSHSWWFSGFSYLGNSDGPGWPLVIPLLLIVGAAASVVAPRSMTAAKIAGRTGLTASALTIFLLAFSYPGAEGPSINTVLARPIGLGLFLVAIGVSLVTVGTVASIGRAAVPRSGSRR